MDKGYDTKAIGFAIFLSFIVHTMIGIMLASAHGVHNIEATHFPLGRKLCDGMRCLEKAFIGDRREIDEGASPDLDVIEAMIVPQLGFAKPSSNELPKLVKYEQPERIEETVNVSKDVQNPRELPNKDAEARKAELDKKRRSPLDQILGAPYDDDPRKRPTRLEKIIGQRDGSVFGSGTEWTQGNIYAGKVAMAIRKLFVIPPFISDSELKKLRVRIRVTKIDEKGYILSYEVLENSSNHAFNSAAMQAMKQFMPKEGGRETLPKPDESTLKYINTKGMIIDLDGALFRR